MSKNVLVSLPVLALVASLLLSLPPTPSRAADADPAAGRPVEKTLDSGIRALLWPRAGSGTVLVAVAVPAGSQDELAEMGGLSHYLEHLLFDGFDALDERGVTESFERLSAYMNAFTREQATVFFSLTPREEAREAAELMVGMLTRSTIEPAVYEKEKKVILEELAKDHASPDGLREEFIRRTLWAGSPLEHPVGGTSDTVEATSRKEVIRYWKERYQPVGFRLLVTGDLDLEGLAAVAAPFAALESSGATPPREDPMLWPGWGQWAAAAPPPVESGKPSRAGGMPPGMMGKMGGHGGPGAAGGGTLELVIAAPKALATSGPALELAARWLADGDGPLASRLVPDLASSVAAARLPREPRDLVSIRVEAAAGADPEALLAALLGALDAAAAGPDDGDVLRLQDAWVAERAITGQRLHYAAVFYGEALASARGPLAASVDPPPVPAAKVREAARALVRLSRPRTRAAWVGPGGPAERADLPEAADARPVAEGSSLEPGPMGSLVATLPNGLQLGILPESGSPVFGIHLLVADRSFVEPAESPGIADLMHRLLLGGTAVSGSRELARRLERAGIDFKPADSAMIPFDDRYHVPGFSYARLEGPREGFTDALTLLSETLRAPRWDAEGWRSATSAHQRSREAGARGGSRAARVFLGALFGDGHPLAQPVSGSVDAPLPTEEQVRTTWGTWPGGYFAPPRIILTIASPLPASRTLALVEDLFGGGAERAPVRGPYPEPAGSGAAPEIPTGDAPQVTVLWGRLVDVAPEDAAALLVATNALSDRMVAVIREREGLAYRLGAGARVVPGGSWILSASVGTRPENRDRVAALLHALVDELRETTPASEDLARLAARDRRSRMLRTLSAASRAYRLGRRLFEGPSSTLSVDDAAFAAVTPEDVREAARNYMDPEQMLLVVTP